MMDDLRFYVLFNSISIIAGRLADDNKRLCAMEPSLRLRLRRLRLERGCNPKLLDLWASALPTELPGLLFDRDLPVF